MITFPNAKINIGLNIVSERPDGYHDLETVFYPINIQDALEINLQKPIETGLLKNLEGNPLLQRENEFLKRTRSTGHRIRRSIDTGILRHDNQEGDYSEGEGYSLTLVGDKVEGNPEDNLVIKALRMMRQDFELPDIDIRLYKQIPSGAGLGGGSSDCANMILLLNKRFNLRMTQSSMERYAAKLGADCAFFIRNTPVFATGIGTEMTGIDLSLKGYTLLLVKPDVHVSTKMAYSMVRCGRPEIALTDAIRRPVEEWKDIIANDFEQSVFSLFPQVGQIKDKLYEMGAVYASMSGSGSAVYGIFRKPLDKPERHFPTLFCAQREML